MSCGYYVPTINAEFGRTITDSEINAEFQRIEEMMECLCGLVDESSTVDNTVVNLGSITSTTKINPADGVLQFMTVEGDVDINLLTPDIGEPRLITLVIADGGDGRFNLPQGSAWTSNANGTTMDGKPWDSQGTGGDYGAVVTCVYDGEGWVFAVYARHDIDFTAAPEVEDVYRWR